MMPKDTSAKRPAQLIREKIAKRAALELKDGMNVNLGIGIPVLATNFLSPNVNVTFHSENGLLAMGSYPDESEVDVDLINAAKETVSILPEASFFSSDESFAGDLANWMVPGKLVKDFGGAADLIAARVAGTRVIVVMEHCSRDGKSKIVEQCDLPLTGSNCVDMIVTEMGVFRFMPEQGLTLTEMADEVSLDDITKATGCNFKKHKYQEEKFLQCHKNLTRHQ